MTQKPSIILEKTESGIAPLDHESEAQLEELALGTEFEAKPLTNRSNRQLRLYWAVLREVCGATEKWATPTHLHDALKMDLEYRVIIERLDGKKYWIPDSTSFSAMDPMDFNQYFNTAMRRLSEVCEYDVLESYYEMTNQNGRAA